MTTRAVGVRPTASPSPLPQFIDCDGCAGTGIMTPRSLDEQAPRAVFACQQCGGTGGFLHSVETVLPDLADWPRTPAGAR